MLFLRYEQDCREIIIITNFLQDDVERKRSACYMFMNCSNWVTYVRYPLHIKKISQLHTPSEGRAKQQHRGRMMSPAEAFNWVIESIRQLFTTPISGWDWAQWLLALILLSCCCGGGCSFSCCRNRRRRGRYYRSNGADNNNSNADEDYDDRYHRADERWGVKNIKYEAKQVA